MSYSIAGLNFSSSAVPSSMEQFRKAYSQNTGNLLFHFAAEKLIKLDEKRFDWNLHSATKANGCEGVILPMANHLGAHIDLSINGPKVSRADVPIVILGLGAQFPEANLAFYRKVPQGTVNWLRDVSNKSGKKNIAVRGKYTFDLMKKLGLSDSVVITGCQSNFIHESRRLGQVIFKKFNALSCSDLKDGICVTAGSHTKKHLSILERSLINFVTQSGAQYLIQNPRDVISLTIGWDDDVREGAVEAIRDEFFPDWTAEQVSRWYKKYGSVYISVPQWLLDMSRKSFVVGTRIHGIQAAIQSGTPALCICIDSRTKELCDAMCIPYVMARDYTNGITVDDCRREFEKWDFENYDRNRIRLARRMKVFLEENQIEPTAHLAKLAR